MAETPSNPLQDAINLVRFGPCRSANRPQDWIAVASPMCAHCLDGEDVNLAAARIILESLEAAQPDDSIACHEQGWRNKWEAAIEMAAQAQVELDSLRLIVERVTDWQSLSNEAMRLRCGELTAREIRLIRAVLAAIKP